MKYVIDAYSIWEFGKRKDAEGNPHQEDSLYPAHGSLSDADRTFILCDGMGGQRHSLRGHEPFSSCRRPRRWRHIH